jgi:ATP-dependent helicase/nuclease subunit A
MSAADRTEPARNPRGSAWVSANAGSGKTHVLADRVTRLLFDGAKPERILCLTYTKAAAAEMSGRLFERLGKWALTDDDTLRAELVKVGIETADGAALRRARRLFAEALETPGGLKIQTIHSFCQNVLARFPVEAGVPPRFRILDDRTASELMRDARLAVLTKAADGDEELTHAVSILATRTADARLAEILDQVTGKAGRIEEILARHGGDRARFFSALRISLGVAPGLDADGVVRAFCEELGAERALCKQLAHWLKTGKTTDQRAGDKFTAFLAAGDSSGYAALQSVFLTDEGTPRAKLPTKDMRDKHPDLAAAFDALSARVIAAQERRKAAAIATLTEALLTVALAVLEQYTARKKARASLDYDDLTRFTLRLLERPGKAEWVLYKLDGGIDHILVDEAQDTSPAQWRIVAALVEEFYAGLGRHDGDRIRTLFAVGDEKQSIFGFQGAVPEEFGRHAALFRKHFQAAGLVFADVRLPVSRRSTKAVLGFVDAVFAKETARDGLSFSGEQVLHEPYRAEIGRVEVWPALKAPDVPERDGLLPVDAPSPRGSHVLLAEKIAQRIALWLKDGTTLPGSTRAIEPGDILILVRRRNAFTQEVIRQLLERKVAVAGADRMVLLDQIAIADLVALGRFTLLPEDDLTLAALLKSPLVNISETQLTALAHGRQGTLWSTLVRRRAEPEFAGAHAFLAETLARADFVPPYEFYARILSGGARRKMLARFGPEADDAIGEFMSLAKHYEDGHPPSLEGFLDWVERGASEVKRDMEKGGGAVRIMTVHGAKGLEANIVIVPDTAQIPEHAKKAGVLYTDDFLYFGVSQGEETAAVSAARAAAHVGEMREYRRLLYVALTRARDWLILCAHEGKRPMPEGAWYKLIMGAGAGGRTEDDGIGGTVIAFGNAPGTGGVRGGPTKVTNGSLPDFLTRVAEERATRPRVLRPSEALDLDEPALNSPIRDAKGRLFRRGLLVHALLASLPDVAPEARADAALRFLLQRGVSEEDAHAAAKEVMAVLQNPDFAPLFAAGSRAEVTITAELPELGEGARVSGQIDRLAVTDDEVLIADFKTNRPPPHRIEDTPDIYLAQMALYHAALQKLYPDKRVACVLVWTHETRAIRLPDSALDAALSRLGTREKRSHPAENARP